MAGEEKGGVTWHCMFSAGSTEACFQLGGSLHASDAISPAACQSQAARVPLPLPDWSLSECDRGSQWACKSSSGNPATAKPVRL